MENFKLSQKLRIFNSEMFLWGHTIISQSSSVPEYVLRCIATTEQHGSVLGGVVQLGSLDHWRRVYLQVTREK